MALRKDQNFRCDAQWLGAWLGVHIAQHPKRGQGDEDGLSVERIVFPYHPVFAVILVDACSRGKGALGPREPIILVLGLLAWFKG